MLERNLYQYQKIIWDVLQDLDGEERLNLPHKLTKEICRMRKWSDTSDLIVVTVIIGDEKAISAADTVPNCLLQMSETY